MFELKKEYTFFWPARVRVPVDGEWREGTFDAEFSLPGDDDIAAIADLRMSDRELLAKHLIGWRGVRHNDTDLPFNEETKAAMLSDPTIKAGLMNAVFEAIQGVKRKN